MNTKPVVLVTGASSGFGLAASIELAKAGFTVAATMRNLEKAGNLLQAAEENGLKEYVTISRLDVTDESSVAEAVDEIYGKLGRIDVLVNNAGFAAAGFSEEISLEEWKGQFDTNFFGLISVTRAVIPIMRMKGRGRIINISSISGRVGFPGLSPYVSSKHAVEGFSESIRYELKPFGIDVVLVEPGSYHTNIWSEGKKIAEKSLESNSPYNTLLNQIKSRLAQAEEKFGNPLEVASLIVYAATVAKPKLRYPVGRGVRLSLILKHVVPWRMWESIVLRMLRGK